MPVHPTAIVAKGAQLGSDVEIGPYCMVGAQVRLGNGTVLHPHAVVDGDTHLGEQCQVFPFACIGTLPQDKKITRDSPQGRLRIGHRNILREYVTVNGGTAHGEGVTTIGDDNMLLIGSHVGHDATIGSRVVLTNGSMIAGHALIGDRVIMGAMVGLHQFARVGQGAMVGAGARVSRDVPPFSLVHGDRARLVGVNLIGLKRSGFTTEQMALVKRTFRLLFWRSGTLADRMEQARTFFGDDPIGRLIVDFVAESRRGVVAPRGGPGPAIESGLDEG